jgi:hypothetical protein
MIILSNVQNVKHFTLPTDFKELASLEFEKKINCLILKEQK